MGWQTCLWVEIWNLWPSGDRLGSCVWRCHNVKSLLTSFYGFHPFAFPDPLLAPSYDVPFQNHEFCPRSLLSTSSPFRYGQLSNGDYCRLPTAAIIFDSHSPRFYADCMLSVKVNMTSNAHWFKIRGVIARHTVTPTIDVDPSRHGAIITVCW